ncbi:MAG: sigma-54 dependent transcriptional regulator [Alphaproteobacteria bacterium]|nr:sigma-54 dependent transcriptional regulator [Alphaproteobacteria bacterium]
MTKLLIVGDMAGDLSGAAKLARDVGMEVRQTSNIDDAMAELRASRAIDLAMVDIKLGIEQFLAQMEKEQKQPAVIACGKDLMAPANIVAMKQRYLALPARLDHFKKIISEAVARQQGEALPFICADHKTRGILNEIKPLAKSHASVLIMGESGTGKEVLAKTIHQLSGLPTNKFHAFNCAAIPEHLLEAELFGYEKGAFTGALNRKIGKFEEADGGSLLLDEVSEMDLRLQAKLLRVLQEQEIERLGGNGPIKIKVRIIATSNRDMVQHIKEGKFREDLFYRLNVFQIALPPLRERPADMAVLAEHFINKYCGQYKKPILTLAEAALKKMQQHHFCGNVRELENIIHRTVIMTAGPEITASDIALLVR